jgi:ParB-like nuclease family protein
MTSMEFRPIEALKLNPRNPRTHSAKQIRQIAESIRTFGFVFPILIDEEGKILAGHGRYAAAKLLGLTEVPTIAAHGLSPAKKRALAIADNKIAEAAGWDREILAIELPELAELLIAENVDIGGYRFPSSGNRSVGNRFRRRSLGSRRGRQSRVARVPARDYVGGSLATWQSPSLVW